MQSKGLKWVQFLGSIFFLGAFLTASSVNPASAAEARIGFIDLQKAISGTKEWKKSFVSFKTSFKKEKKVIAAREERVKKMLENLNKQSFVLDPELKKKKEDKFRKEKVAFERYVQDKNAEFATKEKQMTEKMLKQMIEVIKDLGKIKKYTMIIEHKALLFHDSAEDLTDLAIKSYDKKYK